MLATLAARRRPPGLSRERARQASRLGARRVARDFGEIGLCAPGWQRPATAAKSRGIEQADPDAMYA